VVGLLSRALPSHLLAKPGQTTFHILSPEEWYPVTWNDSSKIRTRILAGDLIGPSEAEKLFPESSVATYWTNSWFVGPRRR
jgi:hypothetical protein